MPDEATVRIPRRGVRTPRRRSRASTVVQVRTAVDDDVGELVRLRTALRREEGAGPDRVSGRTVRAQTRRDLADPAGVFLVAPRARGLRGMLRCQAIGHEVVVAIVSAVYVEPSSRRAGVLRALLAAADAWCRERGLGDMRLRCATHNAGGQAAWTSLGFAAEAVIMHRSVPGGT